MTGVEVVVFDIGETLLNDTREYAAWADWLGVPRHTFSAVWGAARAHGWEETDILRYFRPDLNPDRERQLRQAAGAGQHIDEDDLYPDVRPALAELKAAGLRVAIAGNQTAAAAALLRQLNLPTDAVATSGEWGLRKPDPRFFKKVLDLLGGQPATTLYVGDRPDRDVFPARHAGLRTAWLRRGVQGFLSANDPHVHSAADYIITSLTDLPALIRPGNPIVGF